MQMQIPPFFARRPRETMVAGFVLGVESRVEIVGINADSVQPRLARDYKHVRMGDEKPSVPPRQRIPL